MKKSILTIGIISLFSFPALAMKSGEVSNKNYTFSKDETVFLCTQIVNDSIFKTRFNDNSSIGIAKTKGQKVCIQEIEKESFDMGKDLILESNKLHRTCHSIHKEYQREVRKYPDAQKLNLFAECLTKLSKI